MTVEIFFDDLIPKKQEEVLLAFGIKDFQDGNFETVPLAQIEIEDECAQKGSEP